jgi:hypothetical protein
MMTSSPSSQAAAKKRELEEAAIAKAEEAKARPRA